MPELPDVEVFRRYLDATSLHQKISRINVYSRRVLHMTSGEELNRSVVGLELSETCRRGKYPFVATNGEQVGGGRPHFLIHFGMTGCLEYFRNPPEDGRHHRALIDFENGYHIAYVNQRLLGKLGVVRSPERYCRENNIGPDVAGLSLEDFRERVRRGRGSIKTTLMNQSLMSGLGNVYTDEVLKRVFEKMHEVFDLTIERQAEVERPPDTYLLPRRQKGRSCPRCGGSVRAVKLSGRTTCYCPDCQEFQ